MIHPSGTRGFGRSHELRIAAAWIRESDCNAIGGVMSRSKDSSNGPQAPEPRRSSGRYRFQAGRQLDPDAGVHPEMATTQDVTPVGSGIPNSPQELIAMQENGGDRPEKPGRQQSTKAKEVLELIERLDTRPADDLEIAFQLVRKLEGFHDGVVDEMRSDDAASHNQLVAWAIDADRLMQARFLLENVDLA